MRYLNPNAITSALNRGKHVENFVGPLPGGEDGEIRKVEIWADGGCYTVWALDYDDQGDHDVGDIDELPPLEFDKDEPNAEFSELQQAISFAERELGARTGCWTNPGVCHGDYEDYVRAGRPAHWPSA